MINVHTHIFTTEHVPVKFLPGWAKWLADRLLKKKTPKVFKKLRMPKLADLSYRYYTFKEIGELGGQKEIFEHLRGFYPDEARIVVLSMDMAYMGAGKVPTTFEDQLKMLKELKQEYQEKILPFVFVHPERPNVLDIVKECLEDQDAPFAGIKIYPALGYFPDDPRLDEVYAYAEKHEVPIMTHCTRGGVYFKGKLTDEMRTDRRGKTYPKRSNDKFTENYSDPDRYKPLLEKFPKLKLCLAHFGGAGEWDKYLKDSWHKDSEESWFNKVKRMLGDYENVYTDVSYTLYHSRYYGLLKMALQDAKCSEKILFGTDYYMLEQEISERAFGVNLRGSLGEELWNKIAIVNPTKYLKTNF